VKTVLDAAAELKGRPGSVQHVDHAGVDVPRVMLSVQNDGWRQVALQSSGFRGFATVRRGLRARSARGGGDVHKRKTERVGP